MWRPLHITHQLLLTPIVINYFLILNFGAFLFNARPGVVVLGRLLRLVFFLRTPAMFDLIEVSFKLKSISDRSCKQAECKLQRAIQSKSNSLHSKLMDGRLPGQHIGRFLLLFMKCGTAYGTLLLVPYRRTTIVHRFR